MRNEFTAVIERDGDWYIAYSPEIPGANGQGRTIEECRASLADAISLILEDRREDGLRGVPADAIRETVTVE
jgi:predicted RNase H-like HicB family nuclease